VYFVREADAASPSRTSWDLPPGSASAATLAQGAPAGRAARAADLLRRAMAHWAARSRAGIWPRLRHRPWLFRKKSDDSYIALNPAEREVLRKVIKDGGFELIGVVARGADAEKFGFADIVPKAAAAGVTSLWNAAFDPGSGKTYFFNVETKETKWALPAGGRVVARVVPRTADVVARAKACKAAKEEAAARRAEKKIRDKEAAEGRRAAAAGANATSAGKSAIALAAEGGAYDFDKTQNNLNEAVAAAAYRGEDDKFINNSNFNESESRERPMTRLDPRKEGWLLKNNKAGTSYKKRWVIADAQRRLIEWYENPPLNGDKPKNWLPLYGEKETRIC
jgi:hypothetical protein